MITLVKEDLHKKTSAFFITEKDVVQNLFDNVAPKYAEEKADILECIKSDQKRAQQSCNS